MFAPGRNAPGPLLRDIREERKRPALGSPCIAMGRVAGRRHHSRFELVGLSPIRETIPPSWRNPRQGIPLALAAKMAWSISPTWSFTLRCGASLALIAVATTACVTHLGGRHTTQVTDVGTEHRWVAPLRNTAGRCAPELNVLVVRGRDISARPSVPLPESRARNCSSEPLEFAADAIVRLRFARRTSTAPLNPFYIDREHFVTVAWVDSSGAERVLTVGSIEASDVLLRMLSTLSGIPINASESEARTLPQDLRVVVTSER